MSSQLAVMMVPTCSPASARVKLPGTRPFTTCTSRTWRADFEQVEHRELEDRVVQPLGLHFGDRDLRDELGAFGGLRVGGVEAVLVLHVDHRLAAELLGDEEAPGVGAIGRDDSLGGGTHPQAVGRHAAEHHGVHLGEIERHSREPGVADRGNAVLGEELPQHFGVLTGDRRAELRQQARRQTEPRRDRVEMSGPSAGAGPDQKLVLLAGGDDLVHQRIDGRAAAIDDALPADLDHRRVWQDPVVRRRLRRRQQLRVGQRPLHQERLELRRIVGHGSAFHVSTSNYSLA